MKVKTVKVLDSNENIFSIDEYDKEGNCIYRIYWSLFRQYEEFNKYDENNRIKQRRTDKIRDNTGGYYDKFLPEIKETFWKYDENGNCTYIEETRISYKDDDKYDTKTKKTYKKYDFQNRLTYEKIVYITTEEIFYEYDENNTQVITAKLVNGRDTYKRIIERYEE